MAINKRAMIGKSGMVKVILIIEIVVCYMTALSVISHIRGPEKWELSNVPLLSTDDFKSFNGIQSESIFHFQNNNDGNAVGCSALLALEEVERLKISFKLECSNEYSSGLLCVDLCADGYDNPEQEKQIELEPGSTDVSFELIPGVNSPDFAQLRFFTITPADFEITELKISQMVQVPKVSLGMLIFAISCFAILLITVFIYTYFYYIQNGIKEINHGFKKIANLLLPTILFVMIGVTTIASIFRIKSENMLVGVTLSTYPVDESINSFWEGNFQSNWEKWFKDNFYGHTEVVKCHNQIEYSIFHDGIGDWIQGKNGYLFSKGDVLKFIVGSNFDYGRDEDYDTFAELVYQFQSHLNRMGKSFVYLITPVKVEVYPEKLPWYERIAASSYIEGNGKDAADLLVDAFEKYGVTYYDLRNDILTIKQESKYDVFPVEGHHWTLNAVAEETTRLNSKLHDLIPDVKFPTLKITDVLDQKFQTDSDILALQNVFCGKHSDFYCFPVIEYIEKSDATVYVFGTSMSNQINYVLYSDPSHSAFNKIIYSKYFTTTETFDKNGKTLELYTEDDEPSDLNILNHIRESDVVVMESVTYMDVNGTLKDIHSKFLKYAIDNLDKIKYKITDNIIFLNENSICIEFEGFHNLEHWGRWTDGNWSLIHIFGSELYDASSDMNMNLVVNSFATNQKVDVLINGLNIATLDVTTAPLEYTISIPKNVIQPQENIIEFRLWGEVFSPVELGQSADNRQLGLAISSLFIEEG